MTDKKHDHKADAKAGDFQIDKKQVEVGNFVADKVIDGVVDAVNHLDLNDNEIPDIAEAAPLLLKLMPLALKLNKAIDFEHLAKEIADAPWVKDKALLGEAIKELGALAEKLPSA